jgi:hypothetical protein
MNRPQQKPRMDANEYATANEHEKLKNEPEIDPPPLRSGATSSDLRR